MKVTITVNKEIDIPDEKVLDAIKALRDRWDMKPTDEISLEDVVGYAGDNGIVNLPAGWRLHPDVSDDYVAKANARRAKFIDHICFSD